MPVISSQSPIKWIPTWHETFRQNDNVNNGFQSNYYYFSICFHGLYSVHGDTFFSLIFADCSKHLVALEAGYWFCYWKCLSSICGVYNSM